MQASQIIQDDASDKAREVACLVRLKVVPGSRSDAIVGVLGDRLKVKVSAPPEDGAANRRVCEVLAVALGVGARGVEIVSGHAQPEKVARVVGVDAVGARERLGL